MEVKSVFTMLKKLSPILILIILITLTGCQAAATDPINSNTEGFFNHYFVYSFSYLIKFIANLFDGNYGLSIVFITLAVRLALMPMMLNQYRNQLKMKEIMTKMKPELTELQEKYKEKSKDAETQSKKQQEMIAIYKKYNFNPLSIGCLPMIIQFPILIGFYYAIQRTPEIAHHSFLWFNLGQPDLILPLVAATVYFIQFKLSQTGSDMTQQQKQMATIGYLSPIMMGLFSYTVLAALPLYWATGGLFLILQTWITKRLYTKNEPINVPINE